MPWVRASRMSWTAPGRAAEAPSRRLIGSAMTRPYEGWGPIGGRLQCGGSAAVCRRGSRTPCVPQLGWPWRGPGASAVRRTTASATYRCTVLDPTPKPTARWAWMCPHHRWGSTSRACRSAGSRRYRVRDHGAGQRTGGTGTEGPSWTGRSPMGRQAHEAPGGQGGLGRQPIYQELHLVSHSALQPAPTGEPTYSIT